MVTKNATLITKKSTAAGAVPTAASLQPAELAINTTDRKLYSKDSAGNVFQMAGEAGRDVGDYVKYESFLGSQNQGIGVKPDNPVWFRRDKDKVTEFAQVWITRDIEADADRALNEQGYTSAALRIDCNVKQLAQEASQWPFTAVLKYEATGGDAGNAQHVCLFAGIDKKNPSAFMWASNIGVRDYNPNPTRGTVGVELTMAVAGPDNNGQRFGLHVACNSIGQNGGPDSQPGTNGVYAAIVAGGPAGNVQFNRMVKLEGTGKVAIDMSEVTHESGDVAMRMVSGAKLQWGDAHNMTNIPKGQIAWFPSIQTFGLDGVPLANSAIAGVADALPSRPATYLKFQINGAMVRIPCYGDS
ncbi:hypothetical protein C8J32_10454 [Rhizobium sp. PP-CC-3A-592]|nr:hypothetical protein C8J32_10454 [Rhizobium sp. PP-CC-3A-592]